MKAEDLDVMDTKCAWCGGEMPIEAPATARYCCPECRWAAMQVRHQEKNAKRRVARDKRRAVIGPRLCLQCGKELPAKSHARKKFCDDLCCDDFHNAKRHARVVAERAALREAAPVRHCELCGQPLPREAPSYQRFCSRICQEGKHPPPVIFKSTRA